MESNITCPICGNKIKRTYSTGPFGIEEETINCEHCGYFYEFMYGYYREVVGNKYYVWSYRSNSYIVNRKLKRAEFNARRRWKKHKKGVTVKDYDYDVGGVII